MENLIYAFLVWNIIFHTLNYELLILCFSCVKSESIVFLLCIEWEYCVFPVYIVEVLCFSCGES